ncbi:hypothetical protein [Paenibacillus elgii]|uniref:hypothetical protein n=1 Tax=Paenibacillus elgii TaxID=189691 RepID=UPI000FDA3C04|nr:hypothetical protein [Paenibacillus elgii]NEN85691.1 hypothetical protein [Paenibacillus elgii]
MRSWPIRILKQSVHRRHARTKVASSRAAETAALAIGTSSRSVIMDLQCPFVSGVHASMIQTRGGSKTRIPQITRSFMSRFLSFQLG